MSEEVRLEWKYEPQDYFEEPLSFEVDQVPVEIADGRVLACVPATLYDLNEGIRDEIYKQIDLRFLVTQVLIHRPYQLSGASVRRPNPSGRGSVVEFRVSANAHVTVSDDVDLQITDAEGNIIADTKAERLAKTHRMTELTAKHIPKDPILGPMMASYNAAVDDPDNELIHLYEIRDALSKHFSGEEQACQLLGISRSRWKRLGYLANHAPLRQGRHRGQHTEQLRDATPEELRKARILARQMIEGYLEYLEDQAQSSSATQAH